MPAIRNPSHVQIPCQNGNGFLILRRGHPNLDNAAAQRVCNLMIGVAPWQREEALKRLIAHAQAALAIIDGSHVPEPDDFLKEAKEVLGVDLSEQAERRAAA